MLVAPVHLLSNYKIAYDFVVEQHVHGIDESFASSAQVSLVTRCLPLPRDVGSLLAN